MKRTIFKITLFFSLLALASCAKQEVTTPPNIIFIMADDHAYQAISAYGHGLNETPNIDRIANEGAIFTNSFVANSICAPSRATMLTGKHSIMNGKVDNHQKFDWGQQTFPSILRDNGYQTALIGKIHLDGVPQGFDYSSVLIGQGAYYNPDFMINGEVKRLPGYVTDITTGLALNWLQKRDPEKPFCLLFHQKAPHREWLPAPRHYKEYTKMEIPEPATLFDDYEGRGEAAKSAEMNILLHQNWSGDSKIPPHVMKELGLTEPTDWGLEQYDNEFGRMTAEQRASWDAVYDPIVEDFKKNYASMSKTELMKWRYQRYMQDYLGAIAAVDEGVGQVLDYLDANGLTENTIVIYTSDQGFYLGEHGWFDKRFMYEESLKTPFLMRYPKGIKAHSHPKEMIQNIDYAPTLLDYAGVEIPEDMQGLSIKNLFTNEHSDWRDAIYYTYYEYPSVHMVKRHYGIRTNRYKLIHFYYDIDEWELYDLEKDPNEMKNVYNDEAYAKVKADMHKQLEEMRAKYGDSEELDNIHLKRYLDQLDELPTH